MAPAVAPATATFEVVATGSGGFDRVAADMSTRAGGTLARTGGGGMPLTVWALTLIGGGAAVLLALPHRRRVRVRRLP